MEKVPRAVVEYASTFPDPVLLAGCRCTGKPMDCCEYDFVVLSSGEPLSSRIQELDGNIIEITYVRRDRRALLGLIHFQVLSAGLGEGFSAPQADSAVRLLNAAGRRSIVKCLMMLKRSRDARGNPFLCSAWLRGAGYCYTRGLLQVSGRRPMPAHELEQLRELGRNKKFEADLDAGFEAIGMDYADRRSVLRAKKASAELLAKRHDLGLVLRKAETLERTRKVADAYYYLGRVVCEAFDADEGKLSAYPKLIQVSLGLNRDSNQLERLATALSRSATAVLKS